MKDRGTLLFASTIALMTSPAAVFAREAAADIGTQISIRGGGSSSIDPVRPFK